MLVHLNSNIEIHKFKLSFNSTFKHAYLNSNIEIHKLLGSDIASLKVEAFKF